MKNLWDLKKVLSNLELEGQGRGIINGSDTPPSPRAILLHSSLLWYVIIWLTLYHDLCHDRDRIFAESASPISQILSCGWLTISLIDEWSDTAPSIWAIVSFLDALTCDEQELEKRKFEIGYPCKRKLLILYTNDLSFYRSKMILNRPNCFAFWSGPKWFDRVQIN